MAASVSAPFHARLNFPFTVIHAVRLPVKSSVVLAMTKSRIIERVESRIGRKPIEIPSNVSITMDGQDLKVKGPLGELAITYPTEVNLQREETGSLRIRKAVQTRRAHEMHGLFRTLTNNMIIGVSKGFEKTLQLVGIGYRATVEEKDILVLKLGFSHPIIMQIPYGVNVRVEDKQTKITVSGCDKCDVVQFAASIRKWRPPNPYGGTSKEKKHRGVKYADEFIKNRLSKKQRNDKFGGKGVKCEEKIITKKTKKRKKPRDKDRFKFTKK